MKQSFISKYNAFCKDIRFHIKAFILGPEPLKTSSDPGSGLVFKGSVPKTNAFSPNKRSLRSEWGSYLPSIELPLSARICGRLPVVAYLPRLA